MAGDCGSTCPVEGGFYAYDPNTGGNAVLLAAFAILVPAVLFLGIRFRTPLFSATLATGLLLDVAGFLGRVLLKNSPESQGLFLLSLLGTLLGPVCISGANFLTLPHILSVYGDHISPLQPMLAGIVLYALAAVAAVIQVIGIVYAAYDLSGMGVSLLVCLNEWICADMPTKANGRDTPCCRRTWSAAACSRLLQCTALLVRAWCEDQSVGPRSETLGGVSVGSVQAISLRYGFDTRRKQVVG